MRDRQATGDRATSGNQPRQGGRRSLPTVGGPQQGLVQLAATRPHQLSGHQVLQLQSSIGNRAVAQLVRKGNHPVGSSQPVQRVEDPVVNKLKRRHVKFPPGRPRKAPTRKAKWLRELESRPARELARKKQFLANSSEEWRQHIDLKDSHQGRGAYDQNDTRDDALGQSSSFIENMAEARAYIETALGAGDRISLHLYDQLHAKTLIGATSPEKLALRPENETYGYKPGKLGRVNPEVLARTIKGEEGNSGLLHGMTAQVMDPRFRGNLLPTSPFQYSNYNLEERTEDLRARIHDPSRTADRLDISDGIFMSFPPMKRELLVETLNGYFSSYNKKIDAIRKIPDKKKRNDLARLEIAALHQRLERIHAYPDGNGRANLALLNGLLKQEGMSPVILDDPSSSHLVSAEEWSAQVSKGQDRYQVVEDAKRKGLDINAALRDFDVKRNTEAGFRFQG